MVDFKLIPRFYHQCADLKEDDDLPMMRIGDIIPFGRLVEGVGSATQYICDRCKHCIWSHIKGGE